MVIERTFTVRALQYDGTNQAEFETALGVEAVVNGEVLEVEGQSIPIGDWLPWTIDHSGTIAYEPVATTARLNERTHSTEPPATPTLVTGKGTTPIGASTLQQVRTFRVNLDQTMPAGYVPIATIQVQPNIAPGVLAGHAIITGTVTVVDSDSVDVDVISGALSLAGASVHVIAHGMA